MIGKLSVGYEEHLYFVTYFFQLHVSSNAVVYNGGQWAFSEFSCASVSKRV